MPDSPVVRPETKAEVPSRDPTAAPGAHNVPPARPELAPTEAERQADERYRLAVRATHDAIWDLDLINGTVQTSEACDAIIGVPPAGIPPMQWWMDHLHPEDRERASTSLRGGHRRARRHLAVRIPDQAVERRLGGHFRSGLHRARRVGQGVPDHRGDAGPHRAPEDRGRPPPQRGTVPRRHDEHRVRHLHEGPESRIVYLNPATERIIGKPAAAVVGRTDREFYDDPALGDAILEHDRQIMTGGLPVSFEEVIETPDGLRTMLSSKVPWRNAAGDIIGLIGISRDITERKQAEEALLESEARFRLLAWTADRLLATPDPQAFADELCREVMQHLRCDVFFNFLADDEAARLN